MTRGMADPFVLHSFSDWSTLSPQSPKSLQVNPIIAQGLCSLWFISTKIFSGKKINSFSSFVVSPQDMPVTFSVHKVMHFDRRHRANPSNHRAQTTTHCSPEACSYSCCLITFSRSGAEQMQNTRKVAKMCC